MLRGKTCTAYAACSPDVNGAGGKYLEIAVDEAIVDGNLVTAPVEHVEQDLELAQV
ncbi:hypothetical protein CAL7716_012970 [Calothrix sp. PCC 7716]|nr:hypothetical protein CAL7716_012970 [Calothrix sp. PCC 7716]